MHNLAVDLIGQAGRLQAGVVCGLCEFIARTGSCGTNVVTCLRASRRHRSRRVVARIRKLLVVLARNRDQLVPLRSLRYLDPVLVAPILDLAITPRVEDLITQALLRRRSRATRVLERLAGVDAGDTGVTADSSHELIALAALGDGDTTLVEPGFQIAVGPVLPQPVTGVGGRLGVLVGGGLVVLAGLFDENVAFRGLGNGDLVLVAESFQLGVGPAAVNLLALL